MSNEINKTKERINEKALEPTKWPGRTRMGRRDGQLPNLSNLPELTSQAQERLEQKHEALNQLALQAEAAEQAAANIQAYLNAELPQDLAFTAAYSITLSETDIENLQNFAEAVEALIKSEQPTLEEVNELKERIDHDPKLRALIAPILSVEKPQSEKRPDHPEERPASQAANQEQQRTELIKQFYKTLVRAKNPKAVRRKLESGVLKALIEEIDAVPTLSAAVPPEKRRSTTVLAALAGAGISLAVIISACAYPDQQAFATVPPVQPTPVESTPDPTQKPTAETEPTDTPEPTPQYFAAGGNEIAPTLSETQLEKALSDASNLVDEGVEKNYFLKDNVQVKIYVLDLANPESDYRIALESTAEVEGGFPAGTIFVKHNGELRPLQNPENTTVAHSIELNRWTALDEESQPVLILADNGYLVPNPENLERFSQTDEQQLAAILQLAKKGVNWQAPEVEMITVNVEGQQLILAVDPRQESAIGRGIWAAEIVQPGSGQPGSGQPGQAMPLGRLPEDYNPDTHEIKLTVEEGTIRAEVREKTHILESRPTSPEELFNLSQYREVFNQTVDGTTISIRYDHDQTYTENGIEKPYFVRHVRPEYLNKEGEVDNQELARMLLDWALRIQDDTNRIGSSARYGEAPEQPFITAIDGGKLYETAQERIVRGETREDDVLDNLSLLERIDGLRLDEIDEIITIQQGALPTVDQARTISFKDRTLELDALDLEQGRVIPTNRGINIAGSDSYLLHTNIFFEDQSGKTTLVSFRKSTQNYHIAQGWNYEDMPSGYRGEQVNSILDAAYSVGFLPNLIKRYAIGPTSDTVRVIPLSLAQKTERINILINEFSPLKQAGRVQYSEIDVSNSD